MIDSVSSSGSYFYASQARAAGLKPEAAETAAAAKKSDDLKAASKLTPEEEEQVKKLKERDAHVRAHEMAHLAAAGSLARGGPRYVYQTGPDGKSYATGGSVSIDTSPGRTPEETAQKAARIRSAALAASDPSPQDVRVAATATALLAEAEQKRGEADDRADPDSASNAEGAITSARQLPQAQAAFAPQDSGGGPEPSSVRVFAAAARYQRA